MPAARVLVLHNRYQKKGGEDEVFSREVEVLRSCGNTVSVYEESNDRLHQIGPAPALLRAIWSWESAGKLRALLREARPDVAHFHNTFAMISPAAYYACREAGAAVVQTLHNYRLGCPNASCSFAGEPCERCVGRVVAWPGVVRRCYRQSRVATAGVALISAAHSLIGTYRRMVDAYISTTAFARRIHIESGLPGERVFVKPNFVEAAAPARKRGGYALYVGRITPEKGVDTLLEAWKQAGDGAQLVLVGGGDGPVAEAVRRAGEGNPNIRWVGERPNAEVRQLMLGAEFLLQPSPLYEGCGMVVVEAFSAGLACVVSGQGSLGELVEDGRTGLHFRPGDAGDLAAKVKWMRAHRWQTEAMGRAARARYAAQFSPERNYEILKTIYQTAVKHRKQ